ncbi:helix-turn-helix domain-containing protein [Thermodesulfovibrio hydrogeniphilus]
MQKVSTGISDLDRLIDYIYLGDNVVWEVDAGTSYEVFVKKFIEAFSSLSNDIIYISFNKSVQTLFKELKNYVNDKFHIIDCFTSGKGKNDITFLKAYDELSKHIDIVKLSNPSDIQELTEAIASVESRVSTPTAYIFDSLTGMQNLLKDEDATYSFFTYMCPRLYDLDSIAYWILEKDAHSQKFKANIRHITQIVIDLYRRKEKLFLKALKLARRKNRNAFAAHMYEITSDDNIEISSVEPSATIDIGSKLREIRISRKMSQKELADKVNLTAGFISQMENNQIVPSLLSFMQICEALGIKPSEIFSEADREQSLVIRKQSIMSNPPNKISQADIYKVLSDENFNVYYILIPSNSLINKHFLTKKEPELAFVMKGDISVTLDKVSSSLQEGDCLYIKKNLPEKWENKGGGNAEILLISK